MAICAGPGIVGLSVVTIRHEAELQLLYRHETLAHAADAEEAKQASLLPQTRTLLPCPHMMPGSGYAAGTIDPLATALIQITPAPLVAWRGTPDTYRASQRLSDLHALLVSIVVHRPPKKSQNSDKAASSVRHPLDSTW